MDTRRTRRQSQTPTMEPTEPVKKPRRKFETSPFMASEMSQAEREREIQNLVRDQRLLEKALAEALDENRRLHREAKRRRSLERQYEDEKDLTAMLTIITEAVKESNRKASASGK